jgi:hypothetical protein
MSFLLALYRSRLQECCTQKANKLPCQIDAQIIVGKEGKLMTLKGGLSPAADIFSNMSKELHHPLRGCIHPASQDMPCPEKAMGLPA